MPSREASKDAAGGVRGRRRAPRQVAPRMRQPKERRKTQAKPVTAMRSVLQIGPTFSVTYSTGFISLSCDGRNLMRVCPRALRGCAKYQRTSFRGQGGAGVRIDEGGRASDFGFALDRVRRVRMCCLKIQQVPLPPQAAAVADELAVRADHAVAWNED
jgi:hypothetical protein